MIKKTVLENGVLIVNGKTFFTGKSKKFDKDLFAVIAILEKEELTEIDRYQLLTIYQPSYHDGGKIEDVMSFDSSATNCAFVKQ